MNQNKILKNTVRVSLLALIVVIGFGIWGLNHVEKETKNNLRNQLRSSLNTSTAVIENWAWERKTHLEASANIPNIRQTISKLVKKTGIGKMTQKELLNLPEQKWLRNNLGPITQKHKFTGYVIIDTTGRQVAALLDGPVGNRNLTEQSDFVKRVLKGETVISTPFLSRIPLPDLKGVWHDPWPTMFVATPIRNGDAIIAVLAFRLRPENEFSESLQLVRPGASGETYAFNRDGIMISHSRFEAQLKSIGLLPDSPDSYSVLNIDIRDPGGNMTEGFVPSLPRQEQPLTLMAQSAISGKTDSNIEGYTDYRGVPVIGAWTWIESLELGIAHEIDIEEAFAPLKTLKLTFFIIFGLLLSTAVLGLIQFYRKERAEEAQALEQQQTRQIARRMQSIFNNTIDAIIIIDDRGIIESFNPAAERIFGYSLQEITGKNINCLMPEPYQSEHDGYLKKYKQTGDKHIIGTVREIEGMRKDGTTFFIELAVSELHLESGKKFIGAVRDITERKKFEDAINLARQEAERANNAKSQFLSQMSHELRTPLNAILGFAQIMNEDLENLDPAFRQECVEHILKGGNHLLELINDVLDLSRIETGNLSVSLEPTELAPLIKEVLALSEPLAVISQIDLIDNIFSDTHHIVNADRVRLRQVLLNLISNAIKYNRPQGTVTLSCETRGENRLRISVTDTGPGIPKEDHAHMFKPFIRLKEHETLVEGTGIGLTICKKLINLMNGEIQLESESGKGTTFSIDLDLATETPSQILKTESHAAQLPGAPAFDTDQCVLYIEDNSTNMQLVEHIIQTHRPKVRLLTAPDGPQGLALARKHQPVLILLDMHLPQVNGWDIFKRLQQSPATQNIPVVAISANAMESDIKKALDLGFDQYLTKPIVLDEFLTMLNRHLSPSSSSFRETESN
jgi:PAS domain S-box-containing protein